MSIWFALFKKELCLGWLAFLIFLILQVLAMAFGVYLDLRWGGGNGSAVAGTGVILTVMLFLYVPVYLLFNAFQERKTFHIWMQNPLPGWALLLAKLVSGLVYLLISSVAVGSYTWVGLSIVRLPSEFSLFRISVLVLAILIWCGVGAGVGFLLLWTIQRTLRSRIGKWSWLVLIAIIAGYSYLQAKLTEIGVFRVLTDWGAIPNDWFFWFVAPNAPRVLTIPNVSSSVIYVGDLVSDLIVTLIFFAIAAWLTDHELEVS